MFAIGGKTPFPECRKTDKEPMCWESYSAVTNLFL